eukprot:6326152-Alexandrium_andersonii.AAC.1
MDASGSAAGALATASGQQTVVEKPEAEKSGGAAASTDASGSVAGTASGQQTVAEKPEAAEGEA